MNFLKPIRIKFIFFALVLSVSFLQDQKACMAKIVFTKACEVEIINLINDTDDTIDIAVYSINNKDIINALIKAKKRGVRIRILTDRIQAFGSGSKVEMLHDLDFDIKLHSVDRIMHHKFAIFDNNKAVEGSFNWTYSAANKNAEDCNIIITKRDLKTLRARFGKLWKINKRDISECYFSNMKIEKGKRRKCTLFYTGKSRLNKELF